MDLLTAAPLLSSLVGRDITPDINSFYRARAAVGKSLNQNGQMFVVNNWRNINAFLETQEGQDAIKVFITAWANSFVPKVEKPPATEPPKEDSKFD